MMKVKSSNNLIASILEYTVNVFSLFIVYRLIIKQLGVESLGLWSLLLSLFSLTSIGNAGFASSALKFVAKYNAYNDEKKIIKVIETSIITVFFTTVVMLLISAGILKYFQDKILNFQEKNLLIQILPWVVSSLFIAILGRVFLSALDGLNLIQLRSYIGIISKIIFLFGSFYGVLNNGLKGLAIANFLQYFAVLIISVYYLKKRYANLRLIIFRFDKNTFFEILKYGYQFQISSIFLMIIDPTVKFFLKDFGGLNSVGIFEVVYRFFFQSRQLIVVISSVFVPKVANLKETDPRQIIILFKKIFSISVIVFSILFALTFMSLPLLLKIVNVNFDSKILFFSIFIYFGLLAGLIGVTPYMFNLGSGELKDNTLTSGIMAITCCLFSFILGKIWQEQGVILGWAFSQVISYVILTYLFLKKEHVNLKFIFKKDSLILTLTNVLFILFYSLLIEIFEFNLLIELSIGFLFFIIYVFIVYSSIKVFRDLIFQLYSKVRLNFFNRINQKF